MLNPDRGAFPLRIGAALVAALLLFCLPAAASEEESSSSQAVPAVTDAQCESKWNESEASDTCSESSIEAEASMCRVQADCQVAPVLATVDPGDHDKGKKSSAHQFNNILASLGDVADLHNCSGVLTVGSC